MGGGLTALLSSSIMTAVAVINTVSATEFGTDLSMVAE
jgi:hypothetical protein